MTKSNLKIIFITIMILTTLRLFWAFFLPPMLDESYYLSWAKNIDWGYLDHPPFVAFSAILANWIHGSVAPRFGSILLGAFQLLLACKLFVLYYPKEKSIAKYLMFFAFSLSNLAVFSLLIPDAGLMFFWTLAIHEAALAIKFDEKRWVTAGIATGLGILSKYTMTLIGPVFLIALIKSKKLYSRWPYIGALACIITIAPHLIWNQQNDWTTLKFIKGRGIYSEYEGAFESQSNLPIAQKPSKIEIDFAKQYIAMADLESLDDWVQIAKQNGSLNHSFEFIAAQIFLFGFLAFLVIWGAIKRLIIKQRDNKDDSDLTLKPLFISASFVPVIVFTALSFKTQIQTHWAITHTVTSSIVLYPLYKNYKSIVLFISLLHLSLFTIISIKGDLSVFKSDPRIDRVIQETHGYTELSQQLSNLEKPLFGGRFQTVAQLRYANQELDISQLPGVTRPSEFVRNPKFNIHSRDSIMKSNGLILISIKPIPPHIPGLTPKDVKRLRVCSDLKVYSPTNIQFTRDLCSSPVKKWYIYNYEISNR